MITIGASGVKHSSLMGLPNARNRNRASPSWIAWQEGPAAFLSLECREQGQSAAPLLLAHKAGDSDRAHRGTSAEDSPKQRVCGQVAVA